ncbi:MAG: hypothetical protein ABJH68_06535 [Ilumatobacter sp.]|uniref:hypothetical protein n=1 Tax=Ilumatobacter sp. TaxID=1967498 RepID=UPI003296815C
MTDNTLRSVWQYIDARALDQTKRVATLRTTVGEAARTDPDATIEALAVVACVAIDHAVTAMALARNVEPDQAVRELLLHIGRTVNR